MKFQKDEEFPITQFELMERILPGDELFFATEKNEKMEVPYGPKTKFSKLEMSLLGPNEKMKYLVIAGMVFMQLNENHFKLFNVAMRFRSVFEISKPMVIVSSLLTCKVSIENMLTKPGFMFSPPSNEVFILESLNDTRIETLKDLQKVYNGIQNGCLKFLFDNNVVVFLDDVDQVRSEHASLKETYGFVDENLLID